MKKQILTFFCTMALGASVCADAPTVEDLIENTKPVSMVEFKGGVTLEISYQGYDEQQNQARLSRTIKKAGDYIYVHESSIYAEDDYTYFYFSTDPQDKLQYQTATTMGTDVITDEMIKGLLESSFLSYEAFDVEIESVEEGESQYIVNTVIQNNDFEVARDVITMEKENGCVTRVERHYVDTASGLEPDETAETEAEEGQMLITALTYAEDVEAEPLFDEEELSSRVNFETVDLEGNPVNTEIIKDAKLVMINFWEPWCGPCVGEMPEIQELYDRYKEEGFLVLGVYSEENTKESVEEIVAETGVQYPILQKDQSLAIFCGNYVPVTIFTDGEGHVLTEEPLVGAKSKEEWDEMILSYLNA